MNDNYFHHDNSVIYIETGIPGPVEDTQEYLELLTNYNSQIIQHCECKTLCNLDSCKCLFKLHTYNYVPYEKNKNIYLLRNNIIDTLLLSPFMECNDGCLCGSNCGNRLVQKGPVDGLSVKPCIEINKGLGLFTSHYLPKGTFVCEYAGEIITKSQAFARNKDNIKHGKSNYIFCLNEYSNGNTVQTFIDPSLFGNIGRYINHSCEPNSIVIPVRWNSPIPKLAIFSNVEILAGTEITFNYGSTINKTNKLGHSLGLVKCLCKSKNCNGYMPYDDYS